MMTREEAIGVLECMAIDLVGAMADMRETNPMLDVLRQRVDAINIAQSTLRPVRREQVEKAWRGEWFDYRETSVGVPKRLCSRCGNVFKGFNTKFCEECGAPMTDEAVDMVMERLEELKDGSTTD